LVQLENRDKDYSTSPKRNSIIKLVRYEAVIDEVIREASSSSIVRHPDLIPAPFSPGNCDRDPEVSEYEVTFVIDKKVFWLDIPMDNVRCLR
jgi:hypothetical protein